jgi:diguanylate cyclase (GGDEF)-like protein
MLLEILKKLENENFYWNLGFYALILAGAVHLFFILLFLFLNIPQLILVNIVSVLVYLYCIFGLALKTLESKDDSLIGWLVYIELIGHALVATYFLGLESGFQYYMYTLIFIPFFVWTYKPIIRMLRVVGVIVFALVIEYWGRTHGALIELASSYIEFLHYMNLTLAFVIVSGISYFHTVNANMYQKLLFNQSNKDPLTNLFNRRYVDDVYEKNIISSKNKNITFSLLLIDIDFFKKINDKYGHKCGDNVLIQLSKLLNQHLRESTIVSRWGGEEFLVILENTNKDALLYIGERLRSIIEKSTLVEEKGIKITITLGGAVSTKEDETFEMLLARADRALYKGKENGRNQVNID